MIFLGRISWGNNLASFDMNLTIQLTPEDYVQACNINMRPRPVLKWAGYLLLALAAFAVVISLLFAVSGGEGFFIPVFLVFMLAYFAFLFLFLVPRRVRKIFWQQKAMQIPYSYTVTDEAVMTKSEISEEKLPWNHFIKWKEGKNLFVIYHSDVMFRMVPKRCFMSPEEMTQFRQLLETKLGPAGV